MFQVKDKTGQIIYLQDRVKYLAEGDMPGDTEVAYGHVILQPSETTVEVQPELGGTPLLLDADTVEVVESLVSMVYDLKNEEELQQLLLFAEKRYEEAVAGQRKSRSGGGGKRAPKIDKSTDEFL